MVPESITKKKTHETVKRKLWNSLYENNDAEKAGLCKTANKINNPQESIVIIYHCGDIIEIYFSKEFSFKLRIFF